MAVNQHNANSNSETVDIESVSRLLDNAVDGLSDLSLQSLYSTASTGTPVGRFLRERATILRGLVNEIDRPILKGFATDMLNTMAGWFEDPEVLCCLINAIWTAYAETKNKDKTKIPEDFTLQIADTGFGSFIDSLISFVDLIIAFLTQDLKKLVCFIPDFIKEIFSSLMGAILLVLQEVLYIIRDSVLQSIMDWVDESAKGDQLWMKCLPFQQFINILKKYIHDYGMFADLMEKIRGFVNGKKCSWKEAQDIVPNANDLQFLYWFRDLLIKLKRAVINFDLCVEFAYIPDNNYVGDEIDPNLGKRNPVATASMTGNPDASGKDIVPLIVSDDGKTILVSDSSARSRTDNLGSTSDKNKNNSSYITRLSNNSIANFIKNNYNFTNDAIEQAIKSTADGCPGFPGGQDLHEYLLRIRNRKATT